MGCAGALGSLFWVGLCGDAFVLRARARVRRGDTDWHRCIAGIGVERALGIGSDECPACQSVDGR